MPIRIHLSRSKGWRMPENTVKVDRSTKWGNPFVIGRDGTQEECIARFKTLLTSEPDLDIGFTKEQLTYRTRVQNEAKELRGKNLACWCKPGTPCHADLLLEWAAVQTN